jgi:hypothetical protein
VWIAKIVRAEKAEEESVRTVLAMSIVAVLGTGAVPVSAGDHSRRTAETMVSRIMAIAETDLHLRQAELGLVGAVATDGYRATCASDSEKEVTRSLPAKASPRDGKKAVERSGEKPVAAIVQR